MAITSEAIQVAVERYLPTTANYAQDATSGEKDPEAVFSRVMQVILTALLLDKDAIFYLVYLASQRTLLQAQTLQTHLEELEGITLLRAVSPIRPVKITDLSRLETARAKLAHMKDRLSAGGGLTDSHFTAFTENLLAFLTEQVKPNLHGRNRVLVETDLRAKVEEIRASWEDLLAKRTALFTLITDFQSMDLLSQVSSLVADEVSSDLSALQTSLEEATADGQAQIAEEVLTTSAAGKAALSAVATATGPFGSTIVGPAEDGYTERAYLVSAGVANAEPVGVAARGSTGSIYLDTVLASQTGVLDGDTVLVDDDQDFLVAAVAAGDILSIASTGRSYRITVVAQHQLTLASRIPTTAHVDRYLITHVVPGTYLQETAPFSDGVRAGMALHAGGRTVEITSVDGDRLTLKPPLPLLGAGIDYLVTVRGANASVGRLVDDSAAFDSDLVGQPIDLPQGSGTVLKALSPTMLIVTPKLRLGKRGIPYRIRTLVAGTTSDFHFAAAEDPEVAADDRLTVWSLPGTLTASTSAWSDGASVVTVFEQMPTTLVDEAFVLVRSGSEHHGRYLLLEHKNSTISLDADTADLRLHMAEVLTDFGAQVEDAFTVSGTGSSLDDGDGDSKTGILVDATATFITSSVRVGDRLVIAGRTTYVSEVTAETRLRVSPEIPVTLTAEAWTIDRNSVSFALAESARLRDQVGVFVDLLEQFTVPTNATIHDALDVLKQHGMDRATEQILSGDVKGFMSLTSSADASFSGSAKSSVQTLGQGTTGGASSSSTASASASATEVIEDDVDTVVALAATSRALAGAERTATVAQLSQDELKNRAIYYLTGVVSSGVGSDTDPTLPWLADTGSKKDRIAAEQEAAIAALDYMIASPEEFASE